MVSRMRDDGGDRQERVRIPLWVKLGVAFGALAAAAIEATAAIEYQRRLSQDRTLRGELLMKTAKLVAHGIDGDSHNAVTAARNHEGAGYRTISEHLRLAQSDSVDWLGTATRDSDGHWSYVVDSDLSNPFPVGYPIFDAIAQRESTWQGEPIYAPLVEDEFGRWSTAMAPIRDASGNVVGILEVVVEADRRTLLQEMRGRHLLLMAGGAGLLSLLLAIVFARHLGRHLSTITDAAIAVANGNLDRRVDVQTRDELGALARAFNTMIDGLRERERIRHTFGRFVNEDIARRALADPRGVELGGEVRVVTVLVSDLRGFSALTTRLGPERLVGLLNRYITCMSDVITEHQGTLAEIVGDGLVALFGAPMSGEDDARRAIRCAVAMQNALVAFNAEEERELTMGIGIDTGKVIAGNIGSERQMKYGVVGDAINLASRLEGLTLGPEVLISEATFAAAGASSVGVGERMQARVKGRPQPLTYYPVREIDGAALDTPPQDDAVTVRAPGRLHRVADKRVDDVGHDATIERVGRTTIRLSTGVPLEPRDDVQVSFSHEGLTISDIAVRIIKKGGRWVEGRILAAPAASHNALREIAKAQTKSPR